MLTIISIHLAMLCLVNFVESLKVVKIAIFLLHQIARPYSVQWQG